MWPPSASWDLLDMKKFIIYPLMIASRLPGPALLCLRRRSRAPAPASIAESLPDPKDMARVEASIDHGLEYLLRQQQPDGSWLTWDGTSASHNGITAMCLLAFLGRGHEPGRGPFKQVVERGVRYLRSQQKENGFIGTTMYDHALSTLALIEAYGFEPTNQLRTTIRKALDLIVKSQSPLGGWRYTPVPGDHDLSVTTMQVVAPPCRRQCPFRHQKGHLRQRPQIRQTLRSPPAADSPTSPAAAASPRPRAGRGHPLHVPPGRLRRPVGRQGTGLLEGPQLRPPYLVLSLHVLLRHAGHVSRPAATSGLIGIPRSATTSSITRWTMAVSSLRIQQKTAYNAPQHANASPPPTAAMCLSVYMHYLPAYQR